MNEHVADYIHGCVRAESRKLREDRMANRAARRGAWTPNHLSQAINILCLRQLPDVLNGHCAGLT